MQKIYADNFKKIVEEEGMFDILKIKKLLAGMYEYIEVLGKHKPCEVINAIKLDYGMEG